MPGSLKPNFSELGRTGLIQSSGYIQEEILRDLAGIRWTRAVKEMLANDPVINAMLFAIEMLVRQVEWEVIPASEDNADLEIAEFFEGCLFHDMSSSWEDTLAEILSFLPWGWSYHETVYKRRSGESADPSLNSKFNDGRVGWRKWPIRSQESLSRWDLDETGGIQGMIQRPAPTYQEIKIPVGKALLFRTTSHKNNPEGKAMLRACYRPWYFKQQIENFEGVGIERDLAGLPAMKIPSEYLDPNADDDKKAIAEYCKTLVVSIRANGEQGLVYPSNVYEGTSVPMFDFKLEGTGSRRLFDTDKIIARKNQEILMRLMADFIILGHEKVGSFALSSDKTDLFGVALGAWLKSIADIINRHAVPRLGRLNGMRPESMPLISHKDIDRVDLAELGQYIAHLSGAGVKMTGDIAAYAVEQANMPVPDDHEELVSGPQAVDSGPGKEPDQGAGP